MKTSGFKFFNTFAPPAVAPDLDALNPTLWARESLLVLDEQTVMLPLVNHQYKNEVAKQGHIVNAFRPQDIETKRKSKNVKIVPVQPKVDEVNVPLDFHLYSSFIIKDGEESMSFWELRDRYLSRAMESLSQEVDQIIAGSKYAFMTNNDRMIGKVGTALTNQALIDVDLAMNLQSIPLGERYFVMTPRQQAALLGVELFTDASKVGDDGSALRYGSLGWKYGIANIMGQNMRTVGTGSTVVTGAVNLSGGYAAGTTVLVVDGFTGKLTAGSWCLIAGDARPRRIAAVSGSPNTTGITLETALTTAVLNNAVISVYSPGSINESPDGYLKHYAETLVTGTFSVAPKQGQLVSFGTAGVPYGATGTPTTTALNLSRSLDVDVAHAAPVFLGPAGDFGFAFHPDAVGFISRPLVQPAEGTGVRSAVMNQKGLGLRVTIGYDMYEQGYVVTVDLLCGIAVLNSNLGMVVMS